MGTLARTSLGPRADRTAAHAAVRNLAESYGVNLLPLELNTDLSITPVRPQSGSSARRSCDISRASSIQDGTLSPCSRNGTSVVPTLSMTSPDASAATAASTSASAVATPAGTPRSAQVPAAVSPAVDGATAAGTDAVDVSQPALTDDAVSEDEDSPSWLQNPAYLSEAEYLQYQMPLEHQLLMLEEERDILVDKLLSTTAALHASEARNRESQASASQVAALLNQLQELLRRAEVERDKAKLQLKRQRASASQVQAYSGPSAVVAQLAAAGPMPAPVPPQQTPQAAADGNDVDSPHTGQQVGGTNSKSAASALQQRLLKKHKNNIGLSSSSSLPAPEPPEASDRLSDQAESTADAAIVESAGSSGGSSSSVDQLVDSASISVPLMPSSNSSRPPVRSVIYGFETLMKQRARDAAAKAAAAAAAAARRCSSDSAPTSFGGAVAGAVTALTSEAGDSSEQLSTAEPPADAGTPAAVAAPVVPPPVLVIPKAVVDSGSTGLGLSAQQHPESSSISSTPTAAAIYNASPTAFAVEAAEAAAGVASLEAVLAASYAEVAKCNSKEWSSKASSKASSREGSRSPVRRAIRSPRKAVVSAAAAAAAGTGNSSGSPRFGGTAGAELPKGAFVGSGSENRVFEFGSANGGSASSSRSSSPSSRARSPNKHSLKHGNSRLGPAAAATAAGTGIHDAICSHLQQQQQEVKLQQPQQNHPKLYNPAQYADVAAAALTAARSSLEQQQHGASVQSGSSAERGVSAAASTGSSVDAAVQVVQPPGDCTAEIRAAPTHSSMAAAAAAVDGSLSNGHVSKNRSRSSSPKKKSHGGSKYQQKQKQPAGEQRAAAGAQAVKPASVPTSMAPVSTDSKEADVSNRSISTCSRTASSRRMLTLLSLAVLLLLAGGLLFAFMLQQQYGAAGDTVVNLQAQLAQMKQKVVVLERQLSERSAACGAGPGSAVFESGHPEL